MKVGIFGLGYTGVRIADLLKPQTGIELNTFSANTQIKGTLIFDFSNAVVLKQFSEKFSKNSFDLSLVTFPVQKLSDPTAFLDVLFSVSKNSILLGTTSIYKRIPDIIESTPILKDHDRFAVETDWLRRGGKILRLCGIYGPLRNPADWIRKGLVKKIPDNSI